MTMTTTETLARAETALIVARHYDPTVRNLTDAIGYWTGRHRRHLAEAGRLLGPMNGPAVDEAQAAAYQDLLAIDTELLRALETVQARTPDPRDNYDPRGTEGWKWSGWWVGRGLDM